MIRVVISSPFAGDTKRNITYALEAMRHSLEHGEAPYLSHLLYPQVLDDTVERERNWGTQACYEWMAACDLVAFYTDYGWSPGMIKELKVARLLPKQITVRQIFARAKLPEPLNVRELIEHCEIAGLKVVDLT